LINYVLNYDYIVKNLCENREILDSTCKGKCYVKKEFAKTEKQTNNSQTVKIAVLDVFLPNGIFSFADIKDFNFITNPNSDFFSFRLLEYSSRIFHPPLL